MVETRADALQLIRKLEPRLRARGVRRLALFGSFVRDAPQPESDVDLLVEFGPAQKTFDNFIATCELLEEALGRRVELVTYESLSPLVGPHILREAQDVVGPD